MPLSRVRSFLSRMSRAAVAAVLALVTLPIVLLVSPATVSAGPAPVFTMYVPFEDQQVSDGLKSIYGANADGAFNDIVSTIDITSAADDSIIYYDHWEDGYETDIANPTQPTTEVWGDNNGANGTTPGAGTDDVDSGTVIFLRETVALPRVATAIFFDGRDKVASTRGFAMTRAGWDSSVGTVHAGAVAAADLSNYGTQFDIPVGENIGFEAFDYTGLGVLASDDSTYVEIDTNGDGAVDQTATLDEGETVYIDGGINANATVQTSKPSQVHLITGERNSRYEGRWFEIFPEEIRGDEYIAAAGSTSNSERVTVFIHNPGATAITVAVDAEGAANDTNIALAAGAVAAHDLPNQSGARFSSPGNPFSAVSGTVAVTGYTNGYDWGYSLVPTSRLTPGVVVGWGQGNPSGTANHNKIWVAPLDNIKTTGIEVFADFDGDGTADLIDTDGDGVGDAASIIADAFESIRIADPDFDATGARIYTTDGTLISVAWGQDPADGECCNAFDLGTAVLPTTSLVTTKDHLLVNDLNGDGNVNPGDTLRYTIRSVDAGALSLTNVNVIDTLPSTLIYVNGSTTLDGNPIADDSIGSTVFPVDESGVDIALLGAGETVLVAFDATLVNPFPLFTQNVRNDVSVTADQANSTATSIVPVVIPDLYIAKNGPTAPVLPGEQFDYTIDVSNVSLAPQTGIDLNDPIPAEVNWASTSVTRPIDDLSVGGSSDHTDTFTTAAYDNNSADWTTNWTEVDAAGAAQDPVDGNVRVISDLGSNRIHLRGANQSIRRTFDATTWDKAFVDFDWRRDSLEAGDSVSFQVSTTGGSSWIELDVFGGPATDAGYLNTSYDLTRYVGQNISLRFVTNSAMGTGDIFYFDDFELRLDKRILETVAGGAPPALYTGGELLTGESIAVTVTVTVADPIDPAIDSFTNTATTSSNENASPVQSQAVANVARASIGDTVWHDVDGDGVVETGEPRLAGVEVSLYDGASALVDTRITDANGNYLFADLDPDTYTVTVTANVPAGMAATSDPDGGQDQTTVVPVTFGENNDTTDFAYAFPVSLGDRVYSDLDGDAVENNSDFGLDGLAVSITGTTPGTSADDSTTTINGAYQFSNLLPGTYEVTVDTSTLTSTSYSTTGGDTRTHVVVSQTDVTDADFGYVIPASVGDLVWHDLNANGVFDSGEPPFANVEVTITGTGITGSETRTTDANGYYLFSNLDAGTFTVTVAPASGTLPTGYDSSTPGGYSQTLTVAGDEQNPDVDFGFYTQSSIGDLVFDDRNGDGVSGPGEPALPGVDVTITGTSAGASHTGGFTIATDGSGNYDFTGLEPGTYTVTVDETGFAVGTYSSFNGADPDVTVISGEDENGADFGYVFPATVGDFVFTDLNGNGVFDSGEPGIDGVELTLDGGTLATPLLDTTVNGGQYLFSSLEPGDYQITLDVSTLPAGYALTTTSNTAAPNVFDVTIVSGSAIDTIDFGADTTASVGDLVYHDRNASGDYDFGDQVLSGVLVTLTDGGGAFVADDTTDPAGEYLFTDLDPGTYTVTIETGGGAGSVPAGYLVTTTGGDARTIALVSAGDRLDLDFGYATTGSIGDYVFDDLDANGVDDDGLASVVGIANASVTITGTTTGASHAGGLTISTDADGGYLFDDLEPGAYTVEFLLTGVLDGAVVTLGTATRSVTVRSAEDVDTVDLGAYLPASIGDRVFDDLNGDGAYQSGTDGGFDAVTVTLTGGPLGAGSIITQTDADGFYSFTGLEPGNYTVTLTTSDLPAGSVNTLGGTSQNLTVTSGDVSDAIDFGFYVGARIGDKVFDDLNGNGIDDDGATGLSGVTIRLYTGSTASAPNLIATQDTNSSGYYSFIDLEPGTYTVEIDTNDLDPNATITTSATYTVTVASGDDNKSLDFGVANPIAIGDFVFEDVNGNGVRDAGEPGLDNVDVTITGTSAGASHSGGLTVQTVNGLYQFDNLLPGDYDVVVDTADVPAGYTSHTATTVSATYSAGATIDTVDFGFVRLVSIGDFVFDDSDGDGVQTGESGLAGVTLQLTGPGVPANTTLTTDATGAYSFDDLAPGNYTVTVTATPAGYTNTLGGTSQAVTIESNVGDATVDFGYYLGAAIGDEIFDDLNGDGARDPGEPGFDNVTVTLYSGSAATAGNEVGTDTTGTDGSGSYDFIGLAPGTYTVAITDGLPSGVVNTLGGASQTFTVASGDDQDNADFGYYTPGSIGDYVWEDLDGNGLDDDGVAVDRGLANVTVTLTGTTPNGTITPRLTDTDANGAYSFGNLAPGTYQVALDTGDLPSGALSTTGTTTSDFTISSITIASGADDGNNDFGVAGPSTIGDLIFLDNDGTGTFTAGDATLNGVTVTLTGGDLPPAGIMDTTGTDGLYSFPGLYPGDYTVTVSATGGDLSGDEFSTTSGGYIQTVSLTSGVIDNTVDFGFAEPASIGDRLFLDVNGDGVQSGAGEVGIADVDITIVGTSAGADHTGGFTISTGPGGAYAFTELVAGDYTITVQTGDVDLDPSYVATTPGGDSQSVTLATGENITTVDFGYVQPVTIGDFVFTDDDGDGDQTGETGLGNVTLELRDGATVIDTATSNATSGAYSFTNVLPGSYTVVVTGGLPTGAFPTTTGGNTQAITVTSGTDALTIDFGYAQPATIGDRVYIDNNANGSFDAGDAGYQATVTITGPSHTGGADFLTAADGSYSISGLLPGSYDLVVSGLPTGATQTEGASGHTVLVGSNDTDNTADFGLHTPGSIGDLVFEDLDGDGVRDLDDVGYAGVTLQLTGPGVAANTTITTDATGAYSFGGLQPGDYDVTVVSTPPGAVNTLGGTTQSITLTSGQNSDAVDFGYYEPSTLGDYVFDDLNGNGIQDDGVPADVGISGIDVTLTGTTAAGAITPITIQTGTNGEFDFGSLAPGTYAVTIDATDLVAGSASTTGGFTTTGLMVTSGSDTDTADFGVAAPADLGDFVFDDVNGNGTFDAGVDSGYESVTVTVTGTSANASFPGGTTVATGTTAGGDAGEYGLGGLLPGTYDVTVTRGSGNLPANGISSTGGDTQTITLMSGQSDLSVDFGYSVPAFIGDQLFVDNNANGIFDTGDTGIADVDVTLTGPGQPAGGTTIASDVDGLYGFSNLTPGDYTVTVDTTDPQYVATFPGGAEISSTGGATGTATIGSTSNIDTVDFGWYQLGSIGDFVFVDANGDGIEDAGEPGLESVTVTLDGGDLATPITTTTDVGANAGEYTFAGLTPGTYTVTVSVTGSSATTPGGTTQTIVVGSGIGFDSADFGFVAPAAIGDTVFHDLNNDGDQDTGEPGLAGVEVTLTGGDLAGPVTTTTATGANAGNYSFAGLNPGDYTVTITTIGPGSVPTGYSSSTGGDSQSVTLTSGVDQSDIDFGYSTTATIDGLLFDDLDGDGVFDAGEPGVPGVTIRITGANLPAGGATVITDSNGAYDFSGLAPGDYTVEIFAGLPSGAVISLGDGGIDITVASDETSSDVNFGSYQPTSIGDLVFVDENGNATFNGASGDAALAGVEVTLTGGSLPTGGITDTTDVDGLYSFDGLAPGDYTVTLTGGVPAGSQSTTGGNSTNVVLVSGTPRADVDFGLATPITIGDLVFDDLDADGNFDAGEPGLDGIVIELVDGNGNVIATDTTDTNGAFEFAGVAPSPLDYTVRLVAATLPAGYTSTTPASLAVTVTSGDDVGTADFGLVTTGSIGDYVFDDLNGNGLQDDGAPSDRGISGLTVTLTGGNLAPAGITAITDANGAYLFDGIEPGGYVVTVAGPTGAAATTAGGDSQTVTVQSNEAVTDADFGYASGSSIGDRIWHDLNANGIDDAEPGLAGVVVLLSGSGVSLSDTTDGNGNYLFAGLAPGEYTITVDSATIPVGANSGTQLAPTTVDSTTLTVQSADVVDTVDYGYSTTASIGDTIFDDLDGDGVRDVLEPGLDGVVVELLDGATVVATTTTVNGSYRFDDIDPGTYTVQVDSSTLPSADSIQTSAPAVSTVTVGSDDEAMNVDLGFASPSTIGDTIWHDLDADGVFDAGEPGLDGVKVDVYDGATLVASDTTDANGEFRVTGLAPGTYTVEVDAATIPTGANSGAIYLASAGVPTSVVRTVESGDTVNDADFAFHTTASIGDTVFHDLDANGLDDDGAPADAWLDSVVVNLIDPSDGSTVATTTTTNGAYNFAGIAPGTYEVRVDDTTVPTGYVTTTGNPITITMSSDDAVGDVDFGYAALTGGSIGDEVFDDLNGDGVRQPGEPGISVTIELLEGTSVVDRVTTNGGYAFINLPPGDYTVRVDPASIPAGYVVTTPGGETQTHTIASGDAPITSADFGFVAPATVGDYIWHDRNGDGLDNDGAPATAGLNGVRVELRDGATVVDFDVTDATGSYSLTAAPGSYDLVVVDATVPDGSNSGTRMTATTTSSIPVVLTSNQIRTDLDVGYATTATIGDTIFDDLNGDGVQQGGEPGLTGVIVELFDGATTITSTTDSNGRYSFPGLAPGDYSITVDGTSLPADASPTTTTDPVAVTVESDQIISNVDLGFAVAGVISGEVFTDSNGDGLQSGEVGVGPMNVELLDAAGDVVDTVTTVGGTYTFTGVIPGDYTIRPVVPAGWVVTIPNAGADDTIDSDVDPATGESGVVNITSGADIGDVDAGLYELATVGDTVFIDIDGDGIQDADEPGIAGVAVTVRDASGNVIGTDTTGADGSYSIDVPPGTHTVTVTLPAGYAPGAAGDTQTVTVASGGADDTVDFPADGSNEIAGSIAYDMGNDGSIDSDDPGLGGVTLTATWNGPDGPVVFTTTTNGDGSYAFAGLPPGDFTIALDPTSLPDGIVDPTVDPDGMFDFETVLTVGGTSVAGVNFGVSGTADLGDNVFLDNDSDGVLDAGEAGVGGVSVTATINTNDGVRTYTTATDANGNYQFNNLPAGDYTITIDTSTVPAGMVATVLTFTTTLTLNGVDFSVDFPVEMIEGPVANDDSASTQFDTPVTVPVTDNDSAEPGVTVTVTNVSDPDNGTVVINDDGTVTYTPDGGFVGTDTIDYEICDLDGLNAAGDTPSNRGIYCSTATVTVTVDAPPTTPTDPGTPVTPTGSGTPATTADPATASTPQATANSIPRTGSDIGGIQRLAAAILLGGLALLLVSRRRRSIDGGQDMSTTWPAPTI